MVQITDTKAIEEIVDKAIADKFYGNEWKQVDKIIDFENPENNEFLVINQLTIIEGNLRTENAKYGIVVARFNEFINAKLLSGALDALKRHGVKEEEIDIAWVPGAFEIPLIAQKMAISNKYEAII